MAGYTYGCASGDHAGHNSSRAASACFVKQDDRETREREANSCVECDNPHAIYTVKGRRYCTICYNRLP